MKEKKHADALPQPNTTDGPVLYVVGTPIGNLSDASPRVIDTLKAVALIAAEDTRVTAKLCARFDIHTSLISYHEHNERMRADDLVARMIAEGISVAIVTDAGMPAVSDPGARIVSRAREAGIAVTCVPGPSAVLTALALSGWETSEFTFLGFPPREKSQLRETLERASRTMQVAVFYESPHRIRALMEAASCVVPNARALICNDLTKRFEWVFEGVVADALAALNTRPNMEKGEYCAAFRFPPAPVQETKTISPEALILDGMLNGRSMGDAIAAAQADGVPRNDAYRAGLRVKEFLLSQAQ